MNDKELLENAAKAAGKDIDPDRYDEDSGFAIRGMALWWNPLTDDGDALRLAVKLGIELQFDDDGDARVAVGDSIYLYEPANNDLCAATRRAIVRAAAEIGRAMP